MSSYSTNMIGSIHARALLCKHFPKSYVPRLPLVWRLRSTNLLWKLKIAHILFLSFLAKFFACLSHKELNMRLSFNNTSSFMFVLFLPVVCTFRDRIILLLFHLLGQFFSQIDFIPQDCDLNFPLFVFRLGILKSVYSELSVVNCWKIYLIINKSSHTRSTTHT